MIVLGIFFQRVAMCIYEAIEPEAELAHGLEVNFFCRFVVEPFHKTR